MLLVPAATIDDLAAEEEVILPKTFHNITMKSSTHQPLSTSFFCFSFVLMIKENVHRHCHPTLSGIQIMLSKNESQILALSKENQRLLQEIQKLKQLNDQKEVQLSRLNAEFEDYRRHSVPMSVHRPMVEKYVQAQQRIKKLQMDIDEERIQQNIMSYQRKMVQRVSQEHPEIIVETARNMETKIVDDSRKNPTTAKSTIYASIIREDMASSSQSILSRTQKRREQRKRKAQLDQQARIEVEVIKTHTRLNTVVEEQEILDEGGSDFERIDQSSQPSMDNKIAVPLPRIDIEEVIKRQKWLDWETKYKTWKEGRDRLLYRSITTGQNEEFVVSSDSDD